MNEKNEITWKSHPVVDDYPRSLLAVFLILLSSFAFGYFFWHPGFGIFAFFVLFLSMLSYFFPVKYRFDDQFMIIEFLFFTTKRKWTDFRSYYVENIGIQFSTFSYPSRLDKFRGNYVRFNHNKKEVVEFIKRIFPENEFSADHSQDKAETS